MKKTANKIIEQAILKGYNHFISGMALGFDMICAELVLELKKKYQNIILECAIPCYGQEKKWTKSFQARYRKILKQSDKIRCINDFYIKGCMQERNKYMVNNSSLIIALFSGENGGTKQTLLYAKQKGLDIIIIKP